MDVSLAVGEPVVARVLEGLAAVYDLRELAVRHLHAVAGLPLGGAASGIPSGYDLEQVAGAARDRVGDGSVGVAHALCRLPDGLDAGEIVVELDRAFPQARGRPPYRVLGAVDKILPAGDRPATLCGPPPGAAADAGWLLGISEAVAHVADAVPGWALGVACSPAQFERLRAEAPASRARSLILAGEIAVGPPAPEATVDLPDDPVVSAKEFGSARRALAAVGGGASLVRAFTAAARLRPRQDERARSAAERFLFELLAAHPRTAGRFALNAPPGFDFGPRAAEVDLLAAGIRLAVEVDGYYHFTGAEPYRRDRRKDWELQRHGYRIVRALADDVITRTEDVLERILAAVEHCAAGTPFKGVDDASGQHG